MKNFIEIHYLGKPELVNINNISTLTMNSGKYHKNSRSIIRPIGDEPFDIYCDESYEQVKKLIEHAQDR